MKKSFLLIGVLISLINGLQGQIINPVRWSYTTESHDVQTYTLVFTAHIDKPWHMYGMNIAEGGPIPLVFTFEDNPSVEMTGSVRQVTRPEVMDDPVFNMKVELHSGKAVFKQKIRKLQAEEDITLKGAINYMTCNDAQCILNDADFSFSIPATPETTPQTLRIPVSKEPSVTQPATDTSLAITDSMLTADTLSPAEQLPASQEPAKKSRGMLGTFLISLLAGLGGLLTPCVYPMIPMTVAYFLRGKKSKGKAIAEALVFGISIVFIYTLIGILVSVFKNPNAVNAFITHWITNLVFALIFITLAASFFGLFELVLPGNLAERADRQADKGGFLGAFFMALAMAILSFSCTGPIVASLLITAAQGDVLEPVVGMMGFSIAFALPFTLFAIFPSWMQSLPKSGGWLNAVKVFFAFIMLAFSLYFLSKIDQIYHLNILSREIFLVIWIVIFTLLGFYLLGKIRFVHDSDVPAVGVPRLFFVIAVFSFALYLFTGLLGSDLKGISAMLPPAKTKPFSEAGLPAGIPSSVDTGDRLLNATDLCGIPKYSDRLGLPHGLKGYFDYDEALACAYEKNKPLLIDFVGHSCSNCKKMYERVWSHPAVLEILKNDFIIVALYTDDKTKLPEQDWIVSTYDGKQKTTMGKKNQDFQITRFKSNALPLYAIVDGNGKELTLSRYTYSPDVQRFIRWLEEGRDAVKGKR
ncbi:MAG: thioredoxin family protein [Bacteroidales bacterium]|nr:thioredoxin family protein [Bacteroidales bacterium]